MYANLPFLLFSLLSLVVVSVDGGAFSVNKQRDLVVQWFGYVLPSIQNKQEVTLMRVLVNINCQESCRE